MTNVRDFSTRQEMSRKDKRIDEQAKEIERLKGVLAEREQRVEYLEAERGALIGDLHRELNPPPTEPTPQEKRTARIDAAVQADLVDPKQMELLRLKAWGDYDWRAPVPKGEWPPNIGPEAYVRAWWEELTPEAENSTNYLADMKKLREVAR